MSRTKRKSTQNSKYFSGWTSPRQAYEFYKNMKFRYSRWGFSREWMKKYEMSDKELWDKAHHEYNKQLRDGRAGLTNTVVNTGFRKEAATTLRRENKKFCKKVLDDDRWEDMPLPSRKSGKKHIWDWW